MKEVVLLAFPKALQMLFVVASAQIWSAGAKAAPSKSTVFRHYYMPNAPVFKAALAQKDVLPVLRRMGRHASSRWPHIARPAFCHAKDSYDLCSCFCKGAVSYAVEAVPASCVPYPVNTLRSIVLSSDMTVAQSSLCSAFLLLCLGLGLPVFSCAVRCCPCRTVLHVLQNEWILLSESAGSPTTFLCLAVQHIGKRLHTCNSIRDGREVHAWVQAEL